MNFPRQWLTPLGLAMVALVALTAGFSDPGFATGGPGLLNALAALAFAGAAVPFLTRKTLPPAAYAALTALMALAVVGMRVADPAGEVIALFLLAAFAPLRPPRAVLAAVTLLGVLAFNVLQLSSGHSALPLIVATDAGAAFFFLVGTLLRTESEQRLRITALLQELQASREAEQAATLAAERGRMAREMHDVLAHTLSGLALQLEGARLLAQSTNTDTQLLETIQRAQQLSRSGLTEARRAVRTLRGEEIPGPESIGSLVDQHRLASSGMARYRTLGQPVPLPPEAALALYRTSQEALSNVRKHAPGSDVEVELVWGPDRVDLRITNSGTGISDSAADPGYGLTGMTERADLASGTVTAGPLDSGFRVQLSIPYLPALDGQSAGSRPRPRPSPQ
ncbi:sensor histidine kinase [Arthrobacter sp. Hor0625]|uniref:sensor histidine kinase n=1 Tax=Arthrobacter sp. Hor0625 TaxID=3457358 RepID=UPI00403E5839